MMAYFLEKLQAAPDGDGTLLDHSLVLFGGGRATATSIATRTCPPDNRHVGGAFKTGRHVRYKADTPMSNLLLTVLDAAGVPLEKIGDSSGRLKLDTLSVA